MGFVVLNSVCKLIGQVID